MKTVLRKGCLTKKLANKSIHLFLLLVTEPFFDRKKAKLLPYS